MQPEKQSVKRLWRVVLLLILTGTAGAAICQPFGSSTPANYRGLPLIQNFNPKDYLHLTPQFEHTALMQDAQGVMHIGSQGGVLLYNGSSWQFVHVPGKDLVWSLGAEEASGRMYVGASDNLGYLSLNTRGEKKFVSLLPYLPKELGPIGIVWNTLVTPQGVYFKTNKYLMRWHQNQFKIWTAADVFGGLYLIKQQLYVHQPGKGLFVMQNDKLELYSDNSLFSADIPQFLMPMQDDKWLLTTNKGGLHLFDGRQATPVTGPAADFLLRLGLFSGTALPNGGYALSTLQGGVIIIDEQVSIRRIINKESGLSTNTIYLLHNDTQGGLWLSSEKGLSRIMLEAPFSYFGEQNGLQRQTYTVQMHQGQLFAGTTAGLFRLEERTSLGASATFQAVAGFGASIWHMESFGPSLLIASEEGLYAWSEEKATPLTISENPWSNYCRDLEISVQDTALVFAASIGLHAFRQEKGAWQYYGSIPGLEQEGLSQILQTPAGDLWLPVHAGLVRLRFPKGKDRQPKEHFFKDAQLERYGKAEGIPAGTLKVYRLGTQIIAQVGEAQYQLFRFREELGRFEPIPDFGAPYGLAGQLAHPAMEVAEEQQHWLWTRKPEERRWELALAKRQGDGAYSLQRFDFSGVTDPFKRFVYQQKNGEALWFAGVAGLVRFEWPGATIKKYPFPTLLERLVLSGNAIVYPGSSAEAVFSFKNNSIRVELAAPSYNGLEETKFQYWLEGYDGEWSAWSRQRFKEYTRIPEGTYTLHARALSPQGEIGAPVAYAFTVLPPWYRTGGMYALYALLLAGGLWALVRWRSAQLQAEKRALETLVAARTTELAEKNAVLSQQSEALALQAKKLQELDGVKSRFFANISHEFRTPLSLILNNLADTLSAAGQVPEQGQLPVAVPTLQVMARNARRLLQLINQLLDLSKAESGSMQLELQTGDLKELLKLIFASFSSAADKQQIQFRLQLPEEPLVCRYDEDKLQKILYNLLSNAFKFTPAQGSILLELSCSPATDQQPACSLQIRVQDSGPGIPALQQEHVFNRFYQGKQHYTDAQGTGIGLALTKELVELHQGHIRVESLEGLGTAFIIQLPYLPVADAPARSAAEAADAVPLLKDASSQLLRFPELPEAPESSLSAPPSPAEDLPLILVVEDNEDLRQYIGQHLEARYRVMMCENGKAGLVQAQETLPDLIISDWMMPEMDGLSMCQLLKTDERTSHIPLIMLTALATTDAKLQGLETGADEYLTKPFHAQELQIRIHNLLENRRKQREYFSRIVRLEPSQLVIASADEKFLLRMMQLVEARMSDSEFSVEEFSREAGLSRVHLHRKLKALTGQAPSDFIRMMRLKQAAQLLEARAGNIAEIAYQVGFNNLSYFSKCFRQEFGVLPTAYAAGKGATQ